MLGLSPSVRIFLSTQPADMRRSFDGLARMVEQFMGADPLSGHLFVFRNKRSDRVKLLYWDRDGYALWYKRLEQGTFRFALPTGAQAAQGCVEATAGELAMLLEGIDLKYAKRSPRYARRATRKLVESSRC